MQISSAHNYQYALATLTQANLREEELNQEKKNLEEINNEEIKRIREEIKTSSITGIGGTLNITA